MLVGLVAFSKTLWLQEGFYSSIILLRDIFLRVRQSQRLVLMLLIFIFFFFLFSSLFSFFFLLPSFLPSIVPSFPPSFISISFLPLSSCLHFILSFDSFSQKDGSANINKMRQNFLLFPDKKDNLPQIHIVQLMLYAQGKLVFLM